MKIEINVNDLEELLALARYGLHDALRDYSDDDWNHGYMSSYHDYRKHLHELIAVVSDLVYGA